MDALNLTQSCQPQLNARGVLSACRRRRFCRPLSGAESAAPLLTTCAAGISQTPTATSAGTEGGGKEGRAWSLVESLIDFLEEKIDTCLEVLPLHPSVDPDYVLAGNFAPVDELPPTPCRVVRGSIPACLRGGAYVRIGPNPRYRPRGPYHQFDGDGMAHSLLLPDEGAADVSLATACSRYVHTQKHAVESRAGRPVLPNLFALRGVAGVARVAAFLVRTITGGVDLRMGFNPINANLFLFNDRLLALGDADFPYHVHLCPEYGDISTIGRWEIDSKVFRGLAAHPKVDPDTSEVFVLRYGPLPPFLTYFWFDGKGKPQPEVPMTSVPQFSVFHDFSITKNYAVLVDSKLVIDPLGMASGKWCPMFRFDQGSVPRVGLLPRCAVPGDEPRWFEVPGFSPLHVVNAWEDGDAVVLVAPNVLNMEHLVDRMDLLYSHMEMVRIDIKKNVTTRTPLTTGSVDFGSINPAYTGRKSRYAYLSLVADNPPMAKGVVKLDLKLAEERRDCLVAKKEYGPGCFGGEPFFVARCEGIGCGDEDDGYVVTYVHDENKGESRFVVMDTRSPELETVAEVALPRRVPYGFHGIFLKRAELWGQRPPPDQMHHV